MGLSVANETTGERAALLEDLELISVSDLDAVPEEASVTDVPESDAMSSVGDGGDGPGSDAEKKNRRRRKSHHYGNPKYGCLTDEEAISAGTGRTCAPKIKTTKHHATMSVSVPTPHCRIGIGHQHGNGCPHDADVHHKSRAMPVCLAKGSLSAPTQDPYMAGAFHCLLSCPCSTGKTKKGACSNESHQHCPNGATCERGELRNMARGVCTYH